MQNLKKLFVIGMISITMVVLYALVLFLIIDLFSFFECGRGRIFYTIKHRYCSFLRNEYRVTEDIHNFFVEYRKLYKWETETSFSKNSRSLDDVISYIDRLESRQKSRKVVKLYTKTPLYKAMYE